MATTIVHTTTPTSSYSLDRLAQMKSRRSSTMSSTFSLDSTSRSRPSTSSHSRGPSVASLYTLSRDSFATQIARLACVKLPQTSSISDATVAAPSASTCLTTLSDGVKDIQRWLRNAAEVLQGLDAEDDIQWAQQAGAEGLQNVDEAMKDFERLIQSYVTSVEELQLRQDKSISDKKDMLRLLDQIEEIASQWEDRKTKLEAVKTQVELALEWEELQSGVLSEITEELENLTKAVYEMEERRHHGGPSFEHDIYTTPRREIYHSSSPISPSVESPGNTNTTDEGTNLISLFASMQPLRASLDFLPIRLSTFQQRARDMFPTACDELDTRQAGLEKLWTQLELDAHTLRKELGEDRWLNVFRNAAQQATRMMDSVRRSLDQVDEALDPDMERLHAPMTLRKIESYRAKKAHYCPAIERVLEILTKGTKERTSLNGEVIRMQTDARRRWQSLRSSISNLDATLDEYDAYRQTRLQLRESMSTISTQDRSREPSVERLTPATSPATSPYLLPSRKASFGDIRSRTSINQPSLNSTRSYMSIRTSASPSHSQEPLTPQYTPRPSMLPVRIRDETYLSPHTYRYSDRPRTPIHTQSSNTNSTSTPARPSHLMTPSSSSATPRPNRPRWNSSTKVEYARKPDTPVSTARSSSRLRQRDSLAEMSFAQSVGPGLPMSLPNSQTPLRGKASRLFTSSAIDVPSQTPQTPQASFLRSSRSRALFESENTQNRSHAPMAFAASCISPLSSYTNTRATPLRTRASLGPGRLSSAYAYKPDSVAYGTSTPRSGTAMGLRGVKSVVGLQTPTPGIGGAGGKPRWRP